jgi:hypothetical protein
MLPSARAALLVPVATAGVLLATALAPSPRGPDLARSTVKDDNNVIIVRGTKCPKSHPHKVGSSSAASWTRIDGGKIVHRSRRSSICAR